MTMEQRQRRSSIVAQLRGLDVGADDHADDESDVSDAEDDSDWRDSDGTTMASIYAQLEGAQDTEESGS